MTLFWIALICAFAGAVLLLRAYRQLLALDAGCEAAAAAVDAETASRHAMLPALVGVMRAFAAEERDAVEVVVKAHAAATRAGSPQARLFAETRLGDGVRQLVASGETSQRLVRLDEFRELRVALEDSERRLAAARRGLAVAVDAFNVALNCFPLKILAMRMRLTPRAFYDIGGERSFAEEFAA